MKRNSTCSKVKKYVVLTFKTISLCGFLFFMNYPFKKSPKPKPWEPNRNSTKKRFPNAIIAGIPRSGSEALERYLGLHPGIAMKQGESMFFDRNRKMGVEWYLKQMPLSTKDQITIERSPTYFNQPGVPEKIYQLNKKTKIIAIFKDPLTRMISSYTRLEEDKYGMDRPDKYRSLEKILLLPDGSLRKDYNPLDIGLYAKHLKDWLALFPANQILLIDGERFIRDPVRELRKAEEFLELDDHFKASMFIKNNQTGYFCRVNPESSSPICFKRKGSPRLPISTNMRKLLWDYYDSDVAEFCEMTRLYWEKEMSWCESWDQMLEERNST